MEENNRIKELEVRLQKAESDLKELIAECYGVREGVLPEGTVIGAIQKVRSLYDNNQKSIKFSVSPEFLISAIIQGVSKNVCCDLAKKISSLEVFEAVRRGEITSQEGAQILQYKKISESFKYKLCRFLERILL